MRVSTRGVTAEREGALQELRAFGCVASALISRDGLIIAADLPGGVSQETFSIMCAAIMGASMTATTELRRNPPQKIILESPDIRIAIFALGRKSILVAALPARADVGPVEAKVPELRRMVESEEP